MGSAGLGMITVEDAATILNCDVRTIYRMVRDRRLSHYRTSGNRILFRPEDVWAQHNNLDRLLFLIGMAAMKGVISIPPPQAVAVNMVDWDGVSQ